MFHYSISNNAEFIKRNEEIASIAATSLYKGGQRSGLKILINPAWRFVKSFFILKGFMDGYAGFIIAKNSAAQAYLKYKKLNSLNRKRESLAKEPIAVSFTDK